jgi:murein DD-endopeptidase MepM/ murein hydrolase activator NlpD
MTYRAFTPVRTPLAAGAALIALGLAAAPVAAANFESTLAATEGSGLPEGHASEDWLATEGTATAVADGDEHEVTLEASNLVPDGLYTFWWVTPGVISTAMGPGGGVPGNDFRAEEDGSAEVTIRVPADNDYGMMVVAYHADDETHGDSPGEMGEVTFQHLEGPWPGPAND